MPVVLSRFSQFRSLPMLLGLVGHGGRRRDGSGKVMVLMEARVQLAGAGGAAVLGGVGVDAVEVRVGGASHQAGQGGGVVEPCNVQNNYYH